MNPDENITSLAGIYERFCHEYGVRSREGICYAANANLRLEKTRFDTIEALVFEGEVSTIAIRLDGREYALTYTLNPLVVQQEIAHRVREGRRDVLLNRVRRLVTDKELAKRLGPFQEAVLEEGRGLEDHSGKPVSRIAQYAAEYHTSNLQELWGYLVSELRGLRKKESESNKKKRAKRNPDEKRKCHAAPGSDNRGSDHRSEPSQPAADTPGSDSESSRLAL